MKKLILVSLLSFLSLHALDEHNESKIFLDKYSTSIKKATQEINISKDISNISAAKLCKDTNVSDSIKADVKNMIANKLSDKKIEASAKNDAQIIHTDKFKKQLREAKDNLLYDKELNWAEQAVIAKEHISTIESKSQNDFYFNSKETIYIFVSSSMPEITIKNYLESTKYIQNNVVFVMQGAIGGMQKIKPTLLWIKELIGEKYANVKIIIEPRISKRFSIERVPAILYTEQDIINTQAEDVSDTYIFYGDMPVAYSLKKMLEKKQNDFLQNIVKKLETR